MLQLSCGMSRYTGSMHQSRDFYGGRQMPFKLHISHPTISNPNISNFKISDLNISNLKISNLNISNLVATAGCFSIRKLDSLAPPPAPDVSTRKERGRSLGRDLFPDPMHHACEKRVWAMAMGTLPLAPYRFLTPQAFA